MRFYVYLPSQIFTVSEVLCLESLRKLAKISVARLDSAKLFLGNGPNKIWLSSNISG